MTPRPVMQAAVEDVVAVVVALVFLQPRQLLWELDWRCPCPDSVLETRHPQCYSSEWVWDRISGLESTDGRSWVARQ